METGFCNWCCKYFANSLMKVCKVCIEHFMCAFYDAYVSLSIATRGM